MSIFHTHRGPSREPRVVHPPGRLLLHMYIKERLAQIAPGTFVEVGVGSGHISHLLLHSGWSGAGYDLSSSALDRAARLNAPFISSGRFTLHNEDWLSSTADGQTDLVLSAMVLEHLDDASVDRYFARAAAAVRPDGRAIVLVPSSPRHWGIDDEVAGHYRRYTAASLAETLARNGWQVQHMAGLTYPLSNLLLGLSDRLIRRAEQDKQALTLQKRTESSGDQHVPWKTEFPPWTRALLNERTLKPLHWLQKRYRQSTDALVLYCECLPPDRGGAGALS